jgi:DNA topoisomerase VI subunit B
MQKLERTTFETSRSAEYFDARQLSTLTGVAQHEFASVCLKELIDNALDACETAGVAPEVGVEVGTEEVIDEGGCWAHPHGLLRISVSDNGPGIPPQTVRKVLNFDTRTSDKAAYRSPTRGAQGNALKTVIGIPYALGRAEPLVITARGLRHEIRPWVDPAGEVRISHQEVPVPEAVGTKVSLGFSRYVPGTGDEQAFDPLHWVRSFAAFNPHATFGYQAKSGPYKGAEMYKSSVEGPFKKYAPAEPTSPHWYSPESLKTLVFSHIAHSRNGGRDLPLGEFVRQFQGLARTTKAKAICKELPDFKHLSDFEEKPDAVGDLLALMQEASKPPKASALGFVGKEHFGAFFESVYELKEEVKYIKREGTLPSGLPFTFEFALANIGEDHGHLYTAINFSPTFGDPLEGTTLAGPQFKASGIAGFLSQGHALPKSERAWYLSPTNVAVAAHIVTPAPIYLDRGKTRLNMEGA